MPRMYKYTWIYLAMKVFETCEMLRSYKYVQKKEKKSELNKHWSHEMCHWDKFWAGLHTVNYNL